MQKELAEVTELMKFCITYFDMSECTVIQCSLQLTSVTFRS